MIVCRRGAQNRAGTAAPRNQHRLVGAVASVPTMRRSPGEIDQAALIDVRAARNSARHGTIPASRTCYGDLDEQIVIRIESAHKTWAA